MIAQRQTAARASMIAPCRCVVVPFCPDAGASRARLRLQSLSWALAAAVMAAGVALLLALATAPSGWLEPALRTGGCGFFYGLLAFHLQRVDPDDGHLQAGLVGAVCGICSLISPLQVTGGLSTAMMEALRGWLPLWLPLVGSALLLRVVHRLLPALRP